MPKLKALRGSIGAYGRVKAGGIIEVDDDAAKKLLATKRFVPATSEDITAATKAQAEYLKVETVGVTPGFSPLPEKPAAQDRLHDMIERGQISKAKAQELVSLQLELSSDEIRTFIEKEMQAARAELGSASDDLRQREAALSPREQDLEEREKGLEARSGELDAEAKRLHDLETALKERETELNAREKAHAELDQATLDSADAATDAPAEAKDAAKIKGSK